MSVVTPYRKTPSLRVLCKDCLFYDTSKQKHVSCTAQTEPCPINGTKRIYRDPREVNRNFDCKDFHKKAPPRVSSDRRGKLVPLGAGVLSVFLFASTISFFVLVIGPWLVNSIK